jgi:N-acetylneuraminic acid mutarotase
MKNRPLLHIVLGLSCLTLASCASETTEPNAAPTSAGPDLAVVSNTWLTRRDMPLELLRQTAAVVPNAAGQSILYAIGGKKPDRHPNQEVPMGEVRAYNVATNTWTSKQDMPAARYGMNGAGVIGGKIYVTGGFTNSEQRPSASVFVYNPASNTWTRKRDMPAAGGGGVTGVIGGKLYVVTISSYYPDLVVNFFRYNPTADSWTKLPKPSLYGGGGVINNKLYLFGGSRVLVYDPITNHWTTKLSWSGCLPNFPGAVDGPTVVMLSRLYVFGTDYGCAPFSPGIFIYDPVSNTWERKPLLTTFSYWADYDLTAARVFLNGKPRVEVIGGYRVWRDSPGNNQQYIP